MDWLWNFLQDNFTNWTMQKAYLTCAIAGGSVMFLQMGLNLIGIGDADADVDMDVDTDVDADVGDGGLNVLSVRAVTGFLTFFGLVGWAGTLSGWHPAFTALAACAAGGCVMLLVAWIMRMFKRLTASGNVDPLGAIGATATVYLRVPARKAGKGKITVSIQGRSLEYLAVTAGEEIATGRECRVVGMTSADTFEVSLQEKDS